MGRLIVELDILIVPDLIMLFLYPFGFLLLTSLPLLPLSLDLLLFLQLPLSFLLFELGYPLLLLLPTFVRGLALLLLDEHLAVQNFLLLLLEHGQLSALSCLLLIS